MTCHTTIRYMRNAVEISSETLFTKGRWVGNCQAKAETHAERNFRNIQPTSVEFILVPLHDCTRPQKYLWILTGNEER